MAGHDGTGSIISLYPWQQECLRSWEENNRRGIVHVATGAGKTVLALEAIRRFRKEHSNASVRIVVPTIALAQQWQSALLKAAENAEECPGFFGAGKREAPDRAVMIYVINSARDYLARHVEQAFSPVFAVLDGLAAPLDVAKVLPLVLDAAVESHRDNAAMHNTLHALASSDKAVGDKFMSLEEEVTRRMAEALQNAGYHGDHLYEKVHWAMDSIQSFAHECVFDQHAYIDYDVLRRYVEATLNDLFQ